MMWILCKAYFCSTNPYVTMRNLLMALVAVLTFTSCDEEKKQKEEDRNIILEYIADKNLDAKSSDSGLFYVIEEKGTGAKIYENSTVNVIYRGYYPNGTEFDASDADGATFSVNRLIQGFSEGLQYFRQGGKGKLLVPSHLGYGENGTGNIPGNQVLIFDIEVIRVY